MNYHVGRAGQQLGVYPEETIRAMLARGELRADDLGWAEGMAAWTPLGQLFGGAGVPPPPPPPPAPYSAFAAPMSASGAGAFSAPPTKPKNNLVGAILVTLFCCLPLGIPAIIFASQVDGKYAAGDYAGAEASAAKAKTWMWWALGIGLVFSLLYFVSMVIGVAGSASGF